MSRLIYADSLISDLEYDIKMDQESLDYEDLSDVNRKFIQNDKNVKQNVVDILKNTPTVDAVPVWIPFKMRKPDPDELEDHPDWTYVLDGQLPDEGQRILVSCVFRGHEAVQLDEFYTDADGCYLDSGYEIGTEVSAWMPLPEPYKTDEVME